MFAFWSQVAPRSRIHYLWWMGEAAPLLLLREAQGGAIMNGDVRYETVICPNCQRAWQRIDFGCSLHVLTCEAYIRTHGSVKLPTVMPEDNT
jgi:hypothetical protein